MKVINLLGEKEKKIEQGEGVKKCKRRGRFAVLKSGQGGHLGGSVIEYLPLAQVAIPGFWDPTLGSLLVVSHSLSNK